jgi:transglutaminase/protease-like cytokinesis protein 3
MKLMRLFVMLTLAIAVSAPGLRADGYDEIDRYALKTPAAAEQNIETLVAYLSKPCRDDREKARAIFRWVTSRVSYDVSGYLKGEYGDLSVSGVLRRRSAVCSGYANLLSELCKQAGLETVTIQGWGKGIGYGPGQSIQGATNHSWNAVKIEGYYYLVDCCWGAGYVNGQSFIRQFVPFYFLTSSKDLIYSHFPEDETWQLLENPVSKTEFEQLPFLKPGFFNAGLGLTSHMSAVVHTDSQLNLSFSAPDDALLLANLLQNDRSLDESLVSVQKSSGMFKIHARFPGPGSYILRLFAKRKADKGMYEWAAEFKIEARGSQE